MEVDLSSGRAAVLVLDVQSLFAAADGPFANTAAGPMIEAINALLARARSAGVPVVHSRCTPSTTARARSGRATSTRCSAPSGSTGSSSAG